MLHNETAGIGSQISLRLVGVLQTDLLKKAFDDLVSAHEIFRSTFVVQRPMNNLVQIVHEHLSPHWEEVDLTAESKDEQKAKVMAFCKTEQQRSFDWTVGPLLRGCLLKISSTEHFLIIGAASVCSDGPNMDCLYRMLVKAYSARLKGQQIGKSMLQYAELAAWLNTSCQEGASEAAAYWAKHDIIRLMEQRPSFFRRAKASRSRRQTIEFTVNATDVISLQTLARRLAVTTEVVMLALWQLILWRMSGESRAVIGIISPGRDTPELVEAVGPLAQVMPIPWDFDRSLQFEQLIEKTNLALSETLSWHEFTASNPSEALAGKYFPFGFEYSEEPEPYEVDGIAFNVEGLTSATGRFDLKLCCRQRFQVIKGAIEFHSEAVDQRMAETAVTYLEQLIRAVAINPDQSIGCFEILNGTARQWLLDISNGFVQDIPHDKCLHQLFSEQAAKTPDRTAVISGDTRLTYRELNNRANCLAVRLRSFGIRSDVLVGVCLNDAIEFAIALWGIWKSSGAYVPLDPRAAIPRLHRQMADAQLKVVITSRKHVKLLSPFAGEVLLLDESNLAESHVPPLESQSGAANLAYVIYTSGSTGNPKGVAVVHQALVNYSLSICKNLRLLEHDGGLTFASISTLAADLGNTAIFPCFLSGGCLQIIDHELATDSEHLANHMMNHPVDVLKIVPTHLQALLNAPSARRVLPRVHLVLGGEKLSEDLSRQVHSLVPTCSITNHYGPTETSIGSLTYSYRPDITMPYRAQSIPIGVPIGNTQAYLLDDDDRLAASGAAGELFIGGIGLARGYIGQPDLTADRFIPDPFSKTAGSRCYKTGDIVRRLPDGSIEYIGRRDEQIKIRGYRVETGEIEAVLRRHAAVKDVAVIALQDGRSAPHLAAYVVTQGAEVRSQGAEVRNQAGLYHIDDNTCVYQKNSYETEFFARQIFVDGSALRHGVEIKDNNTVFDVGANIGLFTLFAHRKAINVRVFAFEPIPEVFELLRKNVELHKVKAELFDCGLSSSNRSAMFTYYPHESCMSGCHADPDYDRRTLETILRNRLGETGAPVALEAVVDDRMTSRTIACRTMTISEVIHSHRIECVDLLKIDVERSEADVLRGIEEEDWCKIRQIIIEAHRDCGSLNEAVSLIQQHGYEYVVEQDPILHDTDIFNIFAVKRVAAKSQHHRVSESDTTLQRPLSVKSGTATARELRQYLEKELPDYMVPKSIVILDFLPLTFNGKLDRGALPSSKSANSEAFEAPRTATESKLASIWAELLGVDRVGRNANFFELGGDSIIGIQLVARMKQIGLTILPRQLFEYQTVAELAGACATSSIAKFESVSANGRTPLTPIQCWFFEQALPSPQHWNQAVLLTVPREIGMAGIQAALQALYDHHGALRFRFRRHDREWEAVNGELGQVPFTHVNLCSLESDRQKQALEGAAAAIQTSLDLEWGPLMRSAYFTLGPSCDRLLIVAHHLVVDGVSWRILIEDLQWASRQWQANREISGLSRTTSFQNWAQWLLKCAESKELVDQEEKYWLKMAAGGESLPIDCNAGTNSAASSRTIAMSLQSDETQKLLQDLPRFYGAQINELLLAALVLTVTPWTSQREVLIWLEGHGRNEMTAELDVSRTVGWFTTVFPLLLPLADSPKLSAQVKVIKEHLRRVPCHGKGYGLLRYLHPDLAIREKMRALAKMELAFNYLGRVDSLLQEPGWFGPAEESSGPAQDPSGNRPFLIEFRAWVLGAQFRLEVAYSVNRHQESTAKSLANTYLAMLRALIADTQELNSIDTEEAGLSTEELSRLLSGLSSR